MSRVSLILSLALLLAISFYVSGARKLVGSPVADLELRHVTGTNSCYYITYGADCFGGNCTSGGCGCMNFIFQPTDSTGYQVVLKSCSTGTNCTVPQIPSPAKPCSGS